jgi:hypothetical protein
MILDAKQVEYIQVTCNPTTLSSWLRMSIFRFGLINTWADSKAEENEMWCLRE